jgi:Cu2+-containing amine oxidase
MADLALCGREGWWRVMPMVWHSFRLRPNDFFHRNPAVDAGEGTRGELAEQSR